MEESFSHNLVNLRRSNLVVVVFTVCYALLSIILETDIFRAVTYLGFGLLALLMSFYVNYLMQTLNVKKSKIYAVITAYYVNALIFITFVSMWSPPPCSPGALNVIFMIAALLLLVNPPIFNFILTVSAFLFISISAIFIKDSNIWVYDLVNTLIAGAIGLSFSWYITKLQLGLNITASLLEEEKNKYFDQSTVDELTKLKNRRDFKQTLQRYVLNYRTSDDWLCIAIADIDFFKLYNDSYGHVQGDVALTSIGKALAKLGDEMGVYTARVGGEEFAVLWFEKEPSHVDKVISRWFEIISEMQLHHEKSKVSKFVTMSIGVYKARCSASNEPQTLYDLADKALYQAKASGRNCAIITSEEMKPYKIPSSKGDKKIDKNKDD